LNKKVAISAALVWGLASLLHAQAPPAAAGTKIAYVNMQGAILGTKDGQKAQQDLNAKFAPRKSELEKKQTDLSSMQDQLRKGSATMSDDAKAKLNNDLTNGQKVLQRDGEDFEAEVNQEEQKVMGDLWQKMMDVVVKYAQQNGYQMVIDVSNQQTVIWADPSINITAECVKLYDQAHPGGATSTTAKPAGTPAVSAPKPGVTTPPGIRPPASNTATPPTQKKQ
jgi:outer membrane protein